MNIQTVAENLRNTIAGKEQLLARYNARLVPHPAPDDVTWFASKYIVEFLEVNIDELKRILQDVELCMPKVESDMDPGRDIYDGPMIKMFRED